METTKLNKMLLFECIFFFRISIELITNKREPEQKQKTKKIYNKFTFNSCFISVNEIVVIFRLFIWFFVCVSVNVNNSMCVRINSYRNWCEWRGIGIKNFDFI